ncbi:hypothetical protein [Haloechinothrix aidingensis]|nr:hypothetical protein [Haloechinothrix aidingensis]
MIDGDDAFVVFDVERQPREPGVVAMPGAEMSPLASHRGGT